MEFINNINFASLTDTSVSLCAAFILGGLIGLERQYRQRTAGLRTNILVAVGAAIFVDAGNRLTGHDGAVHIMAYVVSGIGFLGAGSIMLQNSRLRGLTTATGLWVVAGIGMAAGFGSFSLAFISTILVLIIFVIVNIIEKPIRVMPSANWSSLLWFIYKL